ncbi:MAG: trypsin-like peptidase domain-containing protein [Myxococcales bacterium]|nr:trypsin-like peptidase domain-containing protein [Myxococcales bacterium]
MSKDNLLAATVAILDGNRAAKGTGFVISTAGLLVTCVHVLKAADISVGDTAQVQFRGIPGAPVLSAIASSEYWNEEADLAVLRLTSSLPGGIVPVALRKTSPRNGDEILALGYINDGKHATWGDGRIVGTLADGSIQVASSQISKGFSGGPIIAKSDSVIISVARSIEKPDKFNRMFDTAYAIPIQRLSAIVPDIPISATPSPFECQRARGDQLRDVSKRYFHQRVIQGLFVAPPKFARHLSLFRRDSSVMVELRAGAIQQALEIPSELTKAQFSAYNHLSVSTELADCLQRYSDGVSAGDVAVIQESSSAIDTQVEALQEHYDHTAPSEADGTAIDNRNREEYAYAIDDARWRISQLQSEVFRASCSLWILVAAAGRGKSNFLWEVATQLTQGGDHVCVLVGPELDGRSPVEDLIMKELRLATNRGPNFFEAGDALWAERHRPLFVLIDAINEARTDPVLIADQLSKFFGLAQEYPWLRIMVTCRDQYWELFFKSAWSGYSNEAQIDFQQHVAPILDDDSVAKYLHHFSVGNVLPMDFFGSEWTSNPLLLRIFCETYENSSYDDPKPIRVQAFRLLRKYFERKQQELANRSFGSLDLQSILDDVAREMMGHGRGVPDGSGLPRLILPVNAARNVLPQRSRGSGEEIYDALLDMDVIFQVNLSASIEQYVTFTFERMQDYFLARSALRDAERLGTEITAEYLTELRTNRAFPESAIATTVALAIDRGRVTDFGVLHGSAESSLPTVLDLVGSDVLRPLKASLIAELSSETAVSRLRDYIRPQMQSQTSERRAFAESFGISLLTEAVWGLSLRERHRQFYADRSLIDLMADVLEAEIEKMRDWVRRGFNDFPAGLSDDESRLRAVVLLLGTNSPQIRDIAHEWLYWYGNFQPAQICLLVERYLTIDDLLIRERCIALLQALLSHHDSLATPDRLLRIYSNTLDRKKSTYTPHYLIVEFARKILIAHREKVQGLLSPEEWGRVTTPPRKYQKSAGRSGYHHSQEPEWTIRGPIHGDQSRYTFGRQFSKFAVPSLDLAVRTALRLLPKLGYDPAFYEALDKVIVKQTSNPRIWNQSRRRYERFGKTCAYVASWLVLGCWAEAKPIGADTSHPEYPFALEQPEYDSSFSIESAELTQAPAILNFPEETPWDELLQLDESIYLHEFVSHFSGEEVLWGLADRKNGTRRFLTFTQCVLIRQDIFNAYAWAVEYLEKKRVNWWSFLPEDRSEHFEFDSLRDEEFPPEPFDERSFVVAAFSNRTRTLNDVDRTVITASARVMKAANLMQTPIAGELATIDGTRAVRQVLWGQGGADEEGHLVLIQTEVLSRAAQRIGARYGFWEFLKLTGLGADGNWDGNRDHLVEKWTGRFPSASPVPAYLWQLMDDWEREHGPLALGLESLIDCFRTAEIEGEVGLRTKLAQFRPSGRRLTAGAHSSEGQEKVPELANVLERLSEVELRDLLRKLADEARRRMTVDAKVSGDEE